MNYRLPILAVALPALLAVVITAVEPSQTDDRKGLAGDSVGDSQTQPPGQDNLTAEKVDGQELVAQAARHLLALPGIEADTRQRVDIFGQKLVGSGTYKQLIKLPRVMLRMDLKLQVGDTMTSLQQISDGRTFWIRRSQGDNTTLDWVDLSELHAEAIQSEAPPPPSFWMALGGLPKLMETLNGHFQFQTAEPVMGGELPVWRVRGTWKPQILANLLPEDRKAILAGQPAPLEKLPVHLPHGVTLILGRDRVIPLFPYSISYHRNVTELDPEGNATKRIQPIVTWELFNVRFNPELTPEKFDYRPSEQDNGEDRTDEYLARLRATMKK